MLSERVVASGQDFNDARVGTDSDPVTRLPIPCERQIRKEKIPTTSTSFNRKINFKGDGSEVTYATDLPFQPPGLQWMGGPAINYRQLNQKREQRIGIKKKGKTSTAEL